MPSYAKFGWLIPLALAVGYEIYAVMNKRPNDTLSAVMWSWSGSSLMIPMIVGLICGHFFMSSGWKPALAFFIGLGGGALAWRRGTGSTHL